MRKLKIVSLVMAVSMLAASVFGGLAVAAADGKSIYYEESKAWGPNALNTIQNAEMFDYFSAFQQERSSVQIYAVATKAVYVDETYDDNGNITDSHQMTKNEVSKFQKELSRGWVYVGSKYPPKKTKLTCYLVVYQESTDNSYIVLTNATWDSLGLYIPGESTPADRGYMAITWGGNDEAFTASSTYIAGKYQNNSTMSFYLTKSNIYGGYCWDFKETSGGLLNSPMGYADAHATLVKKYSAYENKLANVVFTYIHTWTSFTPTINFSMAGGISFSGSGKWWPLEMDVGGLLY
ncbi:MAG: hypothetical protein FWF37_02460 [Chloroflexi bacterium]|nr:hypothetical protein [Chloroflexota bacterium]